MLATIPCERRVGRWRLYYKAACQRSSSALAVKALSHVEHRGRALDLGAGAMNDTSFFLDSGFASVVAVDACPDSDAYSCELLQKPGVQSRFQFHGVTFSEFFGGQAAPEPESYDLVHSNFALPYHGVAGFDKLMEAATEAVKLGGIFSNVFFGQEDGWRMTKLDVPFFSREEVEAFFGGFDILELKETKLDGHLMFGDEETNPAHRQEKFWHTFTVIARRTSPIL